MEKADPIKSDIKQLIAQTFGINTAKSFEISYMDATLPIYTDGAKNILNDFLGEKKTHEALQGIFEKYNVKQHYV